MSTMAEVEVRLGQKDQKNILPCDDRFPRAIQNAETLWGKPLPGWITGIQEDPLRCEIAGQPPLHILHALRLPAVCEDVMKWWQLRVKDRIANVYHRRLGWVPMPALPAGISFPGGRHACIRQSVQWDTQEILGWKIYVEEWFPGIIANTWPDLTKRKDPIDGTEQLFGLDINHELNVYAITLYEYPTNSMTPSMLDHSSIRRGFRNRKNDEQ